MELLQLKYFQTVARMEHMTKAAQELSIAQPSLSQTIKRLEEEIGVPLFDRKGRRIKLNRYGRIFLEKAELAFSILQEGKQEVVDLAKLNEDSISMAVMRSPIVPDLLSRFRRLHPFVRFRVKQISRATIQHQLENGEIDLCITPYSLEQDRPLSARLLMNDEIYLVVPKKHPLAAKESVDLHDIAHEPFVLKANGAFRETTDSYCRMAGFQPDIAFEVDDSLSIRGLVSEGLGIAFFSSLTMRTVKDTSITPLRISHPHCSRTIRLVWNEERYHSSIVTDFYQFIIDYFEQFSSAAPGSRK
ncbi:LysR family transcriptional regulator [Sporolactobacillus sp. CPB3-1]|uniref:LysR family transcriptional regulator n=1 Tax=Sporolactobacillus mangiferae TaxID=2940498 RepID=A0ABT0M749_9BACL|nr:LysR family transcriptional regulator [Sporolactobacillus mangiferae]MCL1630686.1 LysR family transcriptional regulator [Sporolactobacillus mangiferae]